MIRRPPISTRTDTLFPYTTLFRSRDAGQRLEYYGKHRVLPLEDVIVPETQDAVIASFQIPGSRSVDGFIVLAAVEFHHEARSEEHTSELQSLMRISYAVFCLKKQSIIHTPSSKYATRAEYRS